MPAAEPTVRLVTDAESRRDALASDIAASVEAAAAAVRRAAEQLRASADTVRRYARSVENERTRRRLGVATLIDVINVEDRYTNALVADVERRRNYAAQLVRLAHETGSLLSPADERFEVREEDFLRPPLPR